MFKTLVKKAFQTLGLRITRSSAYDPLAGQEGAAVRRERDALRRELEFMRRGRADPIQAVVEHNLVFQELFRLTAQVRILENEKLYLEKRLAALEGKAAQTNLSTKAA